MTWPMILGVAELPLRWPRRVALPVELAVVVMATLEEMWMPAVQVAEAAGRASAHVRPRVAANFPGYR